MRYEVFYLIGASKESEVEKIKGEVKELIAKNGGVFEEKETQEKRRLAYEVKHETHGIYVAQRFELEDAEKLKDINNKLNLNTGVLRFILSKADELPELKSKEERIQEASQKEESRKIARQEEKKAEKKTERKEAEKKEESGKEKKDTEKKDKDEEIDKKLEEILNI